jgi:hypothetical protein
MRNRFAVFAVFTVLCTLGLLGVPAAATGTFSQMKTVAVVVR